MINFFSGLNSLMPQEWKWLPSLPEQAGVFLEVGLFIPVVSRPGLPMGGLLWAAHGTD